MDRTQLKGELQHHYDRFIEHVLAMPAEQLDKSRNAKWTPVQHLDHLHRAVRPLAMALLIPKWVLRWRIGKPNRKPRTYEELVARYKEKLAAGGRASGRFVPPAIGAKEAEEKATAVRKQVNKLIERIDGWSEPELDGTLLPHPLLGKLTVREMLYFTIYHAQHHRALVERDHA